MNSSVGLVASLSVFTAIASLCVGLRIWSRNLKGIAIGADDWLSAASLIVLYCIFVVTICAVHYGQLGTPVNIAMANDPLAVTKLLMSIFAFCITYGIVSPLIKLAVLALYWRLFPTQIVKIGSIVLGSLAIGWCVAIELTTIFQCKPIALAWDTSLPGQCINSTLFFVGNSIPNCIIDFLILVLPIPEIIRLNTSTSKKLAICGLFVLGGVVVVASIVRLVATWHLYTGGATNPTIQFLVPWIATSLEICIAIIGACLPTMIPVWRLCRDRFITTVVEISNSNSIVSPSSGGTSSSSASRSRKSNNNSNNKNVFNSIITIGQISSNRKKMNQSTVDDTCCGEGSFERLHNMESGESHNSHDVFNPDARAGGRGIHIGSDDRVNSKDGGGLEDIPLGRIRVRRDFDVE